MADTDKKGEADLAGNEEPRILEETITRVASKPPVTPSIPQAPLAVPTTLASPVPAAPPPHPIPVEPKAPTSALTPPTISPEPTPTPIPPPPRPPAPRASMATPPPPAFPSEPAPISSVAVPIKPTAPSTLGIGAIPTDIASILEKVKLPERHDSEKVPATPAPASPPVSQPEPIPPARESPVAEVMETPRSEEEKQQSIVSAIHTLKNDLQSVVRDQNISVVRAVSLEEDRRAHERKEQNEPQRARRPKRTFAIFFVVALLCLVGLGALFGVFVIMRERTNAPPPASDTSILFAEQSVPLPIDTSSPRDLKLKLSEARTSSDRTLGSIVRIIPTRIVTFPDGTTEEVPASFSEFMHAIGASPPEELIRALSSEFFLGIHTVDENAPLIIVPVTSYDRAFAGLLAWENTLNANLAPLFTAVPNLITESNGITKKRPFQDLVMRNYDVRALKDDAGQIQLYYSFPSKGILVIAESPYSFTEILSRLQAGQKL